MCANIQIANCVNCITTSVTTNKILQSLKLHLLYVYGDGDFQYRWMISRLSAQVQVQNILVKHSSN